MDIGTGKLLFHERQGIPHYFIDSHYINQMVTAGIFREQAITLLQEKYKHINIMLMTGGSGLYIHALCKGLDKIPSVSFHTRKKWIVLYQKRGLRYILNFLEKEDPTYFKAVDKKNPQRIIRALEVIEETKKPFSSFLMNQSPKGFFHLIKVGLSDKREKIYTQIHQRIKTMLTKGFLSEAEQLFPYRHYYALKTIGYQELFKFIDHEISWEKAIELFQRNTRRYAKRQLTWFKKDLDIRWFHPSAYSDIINYIEMKIIHIQKSFSP